MILFNFNKITPELTAPMNQNEAKLKYTSAPMKIKTVTAIEVMER